MSGRLRRLAFAAVLIGIAPAYAQIPSSELRSGTADLSRDTKAMQDDDSANPGMLYVLDGKSLWTAKPGAAKSCAECHGEAKASMKAVSARYPAFEPALKKPVDIEQRINLCRVNHQNATPFAAESKELLALTAYIGNQSRGEKIAPPEDARLKRFRDAGRAIFERRQGQLNLSCAQCHDDNWGKHLAGNVVPQGHPNGYPLYRLEWQALGSLQRRLRNCMIGMRAEPYAYGSDDNVNLELYLMTRARGLTIETPAVRP